LTGKVINRLTVNEEEEQEVDITLESQMSDIQKARTSIGSFDRATLRK
jgi:hypothetical protein